MRETLVEELQATVENLREENRLLRNQKLYEPIVSLPAKFDGNRENCRSFISQVKLHFQMLPLKYPDDRTKIGFIGTLLTGIAAAWFSPLFEQGSPILSDFIAFIDEFKHMFGDYDRRAVAADKIHRLRQGYRSASTYAAEFRQLSCDLLWGEEALIDIFLRGLNDDVKDLLITFPVPDTLHEAISSAVTCDLRISQRKMDKRKRYSSEPRHYPQGLNQHSNITPMEIDNLEPNRRQTLTQDEKERRRRNGLCLYCGESGHRIKDCQRRPKDRPLNSQVRSH